MGIKFDSELMKLITYFESLSGAKIKDCISDDKITFIVEEGEMGKAIGKGGANIKKMEFKLKKRIKLVEFSNDPAQFVRNLVNPIEIAGIKNEDGIITIQGKDTSSRAMIIGRERKNIHNILDIARRYFDIKEIKVA